MKRVLLLTCVLALAATAAYADWCGNGYSDANTNFVEAQVWPGDGGIATSMMFVYTTDGSDPHTSGTAQTEAGVFYQLASNNDWYQATLTANNGDLVKWFASAVDANGVPCESEDYSFTSGVAVEELPNLVGDCESELGGSDWNNNDPLTDLADPDMNGVYEVTLTGTAPFNFGGGAGYQCVATSGIWSPQYPGDSNIPILINPDDEITFFLDTNAMAGWAPESNALYDSNLLTASHTWAAVGDWQGWDPANPATQMAPQGGGVYMVSVPFDEGMLGVHEFKCAADGGWDLQAGVNGYGSNSSTWSFEVTAAVYVNFYLHESGRIMVEVTDIVGNEDSDWGSVKQMYR